MNSSTIRRKFIEFFTENRHVQLPSMSLVPHDPTVTTLFTIAGMQQMIPYFTGREEPPSRRMVTVQKAVRTVDIDEVGDDTHNTFLEMLGNFSVGDYFKRGAIEYSWNFLTGVMEIPADRLWATIYPGDEEARQAWLDVGMPGERIGETEENWWAQGPTGPCGPDSEVHYDFGPELACGPNCRPENDCCDRFLEVWNDVFMMYFREESGELRDLPWKNIDTGMGFERLVRIKQGADSPYDTDLFRPIIEAVTAISGTTYTGKAEKDRSLRIIADHSRAIAFIIADGVMPSAEGRGYVLRRLIRRAILHGRLLGIEQEFLAAPVQAVIDILSDYWLELSERRERILQVVTQEERRFLLTLSRGLGIFEEVAGRARGEVIPGADAFALKDTYGFPYELTEELARERNLTVDRDEFERALAEQQERARDVHRAAQKAETPLETYLRVVDEVGPTRFTGYDELRTDTEILALIVGGQTVRRVEAGGDAQIVLAATPFYAESGGQVGDQGTITSGSALVRVGDTQRPVAGLYVHYGRVEEGVIEVGDAVEAEVDAERRLHIVPHHSATHLLHKALQEVLGPEATQAGSLVAPDRLRFDFRWPRPLTDEELEEIQDRINAAVWANLPVDIVVEPYDQAIAEGAMALFGEKYGDRVRVVRMGDWSKELCGGTHVRATGDIGLVILTGETGTGSGVRRVEALAGAAAYRYVSGLREDLDEISAVLETRPDTVVQKARQVMADMREAERRVLTLSQQLAEREAESLVRGGISVDGMTVVADRVRAESMDGLKAITDAVRSRIGTGAVVLGSVVDGKAAFTMAVTPTLPTKGIKASDILREAAQKAGARAGGRPEFAQGGAADAASIDGVLANALELIKQKAQGVA